MQQNTGSEQMAELVELFISARGLKNLNNIYLSDPQCYVYEINKSGLQNLKGHTDSIKHNLNPDWKDPVQLHYHFNKNQVLEFHIIDANEGFVGKVTELALTGEKKQKHIGTVQTTLAKLMGAKGSFSKLPLDDDAGTLLVYVDKVKEQSQITNIHWKWGGTKLLNMDWFSKSDPFGKYFKYTQNGEKILVYQSEVIKNDLNPHWKPWDTTVEKLCPHNDKFYVEVFDYDRVGGHDFIGSVEISMSGILDRNEKEWPLHTRKNKHAGNLVLMEKEIKKPPPINREITFLDYLRGGWQLSLLAAVDFTYSNGPINRPESLHDISKENEHNLYEQALISVGTIIINYDNDKHIPFFGFGGTPKMPTYTKQAMDDCFPINGNSQNPRVTDIDGIIQAYRKAVPLIEFSGPTYVSNILKNAKKLAELNEKQDIYTVGIVMTDGQIEDMDEAIQLIAECCVLPMSIIIIGIGDENFKLMKILDNPDEILKKAKEDTKPKVRDITQFVAFKEFQNDSEKLSSTILDRLPKQFMEYMRINNRKPKEVQQVMLSNVLK